MKPRHTRRAKSLGTLLAIDILLAQGGLSAAALPDLDEASEAILLRQGERTLGEETMRSIHASGAWLNDPEVNAHLDGLGRRLIQADPAVANQRFEFFAIDSAEINAFALPGGHIGGNTGLILATRNESELASVLAHEISHVSQHHIARQIDGQSGAQLASMAVLAAATGNGQAAMAATTGATAANMQSMLYPPLHHDERI